VEKKKIISNDFLDALCDNEIRIMTSKCAASAGFSRFYG
jgi:hypothetical protein